MIFHFNICLASKNQSAFYTIPKFHATFGIIDLKVLNGGNRNLLLILK